MTDPAPRPATVLLIDDDPTLRLPLRLVLERSGYVVLESDNGHQGLALSQAHGDAIAVAVIDQHMPGVSGIEVAQALYQQPRRPAIIMMSGLDFEETALPVADVFLRKPFALIELVRAVRHLMEDLQDDRRGRAEKPSHRAL